MHRKIKITEGFQRKMEAQTYTICYRTVHVYTTYIVYQYIIMYCNAEFPSTHYYLLACISFTFLLNIITYSNIICAENNFYNKGMFVCGKRCITFCCLNF